MAGDRLLEPIQQAQRYTAVCEHDWIVGIDRQRLLIGRQCLVEALVLYECVATVDVSGDVARLPGDHRVEAGECFVNAIEIEQCSAAINFDVGANRDLQCRVVACQSLCMAAELAEHDPTGIEYVWLPRLLAETFIAGSEGFLEAIEPQKCVGVIMQCFEMVDIDQERGFEFLQRLLRLLQTKQRQSEIVQRIDPPRLKRKRRSIVYARLLKAPEPEQRVALVIERIGVVGPDCK